MFYSFSSMIIMKFQPGQKSRNLMEKRRLATLCLYTIRIQLVGKQIESCIAKTPIATGLVSLVQTDPDSKPSPIWEYLQSNVRAFPSFTQISQWNAHHLFAIHQIWLLEHLAFFSWLVIHFLLKWISTRKRYFPISRSNIILSWFHMNPYLFPCWLSCNAL